MYGDIQGLGVNGGGIAMNYCTYFGQYLDPQIEVKTCLTCLAIQNKLECKYKKYEILYNNRTIKETR